VTSPHPGDRGASVQELHRRLNEAGHQVDSREVKSTEFGADTSRALLAFQAERSLEETGLFDEQTHSALVEAGVRLGDRHLYLHTQMFRGDDVSDLQLHLGNLGFDAGKIDGIFGPDTAAAVVDFQRNVGLATDGIAGPQTLRGLRHLLGRTVDHRPVAQIRELELLRQSNSELRDQRLAIGHFGGAAALTSALARILRAAGAYVLELDHPDETIHASTANNFGAAMYMGIQIENGSYNRISYFATESFQSEGGFRLAHRCADALDAVFALDQSKSGTPTSKEHQSEQKAQSSTREARRNEILRRTRMPAVMCTLAPPATIVLATAEVATALASAITGWMANPAADPVNNPPTSRETRPL